MTVNASIRALPSVGATVRALPAVLVTIRASPSTIIPDINTSVVPQWVDPRILTGVCTSDVLAPDVCK